MLLEEQFVGAGTFEGNLSPTNITSIKHLLNNAYIADKNEMDNFCASLGIAFEQDAVPWSKLEPQESQGSHLSFGISLKTEETMTKAMISEFHSNLIDMGSKLEFTQVGDNEIRFINFVDEQGTPFVMSNSAFKQAVMQSAQKFPTEEDITISRFKATGNYLWNDWVNNPKGETYQQTLKENGREDMIIAAFEVRKSFIQNLAVMSVEQGVTLAAESRKSRYKDSYGFSPS